MNTLKNISRKEHTPDIPWSQPLSTFVSLTKQYKMEMFNIITLGISGLLLFGVGTSRLSNPVKNYLNNSGIKLNQDVDLLNEIRGTSALMLSGGIIILLGIIIPNLTKSSFIVASLIFIGFAIGRILSIAIDGKPNKKIIQGLSSELILGSLNIYCLLTFS